MNILTVVPIVTLDTSWGEIFASLNIFEIALSMPWLGFFVVGSLCLQH
jgi:hypothetical protein